MQEEGREEENSSREAFLGLWCWLGRRLFLVVVAGWLYLGGQIFFFLLQCLLRHKICIGKKGGRGNDWRGVFLCEILGAAAASEGT